MLIVAGDDREAVPDTGSLVILNGQMVFDTNRFSRKNDTVHYCEPALLFIPPGFSMC